MIRVLIADDHPIVRRGLREIIGEQSDLTVAGEAANGDEVLRLVRDQGCDVVVLDVSMPGRNGLQVLTELREQRPDLPVLVLTVHPEEQFAFRMLKAGAAGFLTKHCAPQELIEAIRKVHCGGRYITLSVAERLARALGPGGQRLPHEDLTGREYQVLCQIASGKTVTQTAATLALSVKTVSTYRKRLLEKMKLKTNAELTHYALRYHLVP